MTLIGSQLMLATTTQNPAEHTGVAEAQVPPFPPPQVRMHPGWLIARGVVCLAIVVYLLRLGTRLVRAVEKFADKFQGRAA
jgi:hypothetical protein